VTVDGDKMLETHVVEGVEEPPTEYTFEDGQMVVVRRK
jgi:hypothetical protein